MSDMNDFPPLWAFGPVTPLGLQATSSIARVRFFVGSDPHQPLPFFRQKICRDSDCATEFFSTRGGDENRTCQTHVFAEWLLPASNRKRSFRKEAMAAGVQKSGFLVLFLSEGVLTRPFVRRRRCSARRRVPASGGESGGFAGFACWKPWRIWRL